MPETAPHGRAAVLSGLFPDEISRLLAPLPAYRAKQIFQWTARGALGFDEMTDLPQKMREELRAHHKLFTTSVKNVLRDPDGTTKLRLALEDGAFIEAVLLIDGENRKTACVSSQAGCPSGCVFCKTGALGFKRNLSAAEIVEQFLYLRSLDKDISNIVIMGMGEPLLNLGELRRAVGILEDKAGLGLSKRRFTLSTSGVIEGIRELAQNGPSLRLAVSLTTADAALRDELMPINRTNPLPGLKQALLDYQKKIPDRFTLEMVLLGGVNTRHEDAEALRGFARGLDVLVNLIPWNPVEGLVWRGVPLREPSPAEVKAFQASLEKRGLRVTVRLRKGRGVNGACGQLGGL